MTESNQQRIWQVVSQIPEGKIASYGQVAAQAGIPQAARLVGNVLRKLPEGSNLPWHRVVNSQRKISFPIGSPAYQEQKQRLLLEGIVFNKEKIAINHLAWHYL
ncbi:MAG: methylated-DNA--[protein]-cysteine S-methyltransferase [Oceanicoccus sp.]|uniref:MGMT family protein n=1 Tax=Oceanicoccus sp. TaxID=2691044 RepID=UPI00262DBD34|nr:methylated-DNA--[protein]-cysteine S-methyltransferase [Oceanicoccus sp.]MCP3906717.1 methylated-DNA--[protein]-cysteine S-methyltransferase [Oceanicoccus sp.]MDG1772435.1 methylated-DNA--[protein]-cysteine S-methyltransferase [Oceanicoccus sp.]